MSNWKGDFAVASTGNGITFNGSMGFTPTELKFTVGPKNNNATVVQRTDGWVDSSGYQGTVSIYGDSSGFESKFFNTKCLYVRERSGGALTTVIEATFHSFISGGFKLNVTLASGSYTLWVEASDV